MGQYIRLFGFNQGDGESLWGMPGGDGQSRWFEVGIALNSMNKFSCRGYQMADEKKLTAAEVRKTVATSLAAAFGFVIALLWNNVVVGGLKVAKVNLNAEEFTLQSWLGLLVTGLVITVLMIILIIIIGRWGNK